MSEPIHRMHGHIGACVDCQEIQAVVDALRAEVAALRDAESENEDAIDAGIARARLTAIGADPTRLVSGDALEERLRRCEHFAKRLSTGLAEVQREKPLAVRRLKMKEATDEILKLFRARKRLFYSDIAEALQLDFSTVIRACENLRRRGLIKGNPMDEIERLRAEVAALRAVAKAVEWFTRGHQNQQVTSFRCTLCEALAALDRACPGWRDG